MTASEELLTRINNHIFFKEFTYANTEFHLPGGNTKELADNVVWLDDILMIFQVKGRDPASVATQESETKWFEKTVKTSAKNQIRDSLRYFEDNNSLPLKNERGHTFNVAEAKGVSPIKIIIYDPSSTLLETRRNEKFVESKSAGKIHLFHIEDYINVCKFLQTPAELHEYLQFRQKVCENHKDDTSYLPEQYFVAHFFTTSLTDHVNLNYIENIHRINMDVSGYNVAWIINNFFDKLQIFDDGKPTDYYYIIREIAKLKREELKAFYQRYLKIIENVKTNYAEIPYRFGVPRTNCGFVFVTLISGKGQYWRNALSNATEIFKYKHRLRKCVGVIMYKDGQHFQTNWTFIGEPWEYNAVLGKAVAGENGMYPPFEYQLLDRYKLKS